MSWAHRMSAAACAALIVCACSSSDKVATTTTVPWRDYEPGLQSQIDAMSAAKDCDGMQSVFNKIGATNLAVRNAHGHGNEEVLGYIDAKERAAGCFGTVPATT